jgi:hypothetical protein
MDDLGTGREIRILSFGGRGGGMTIFPGSRPSHFSCESEERDRRLKSGGGII